MRSLKARRHEEDSISELRKQLACFFAGLNSGHWNPYSAGKTSQLSSTRFEAVFKDNPSYCVTSTVAGLGTCHPGFKSSIMSYVVFTS